MKTKVTLICLIILSIVAGSCTNEDFDLKNPDVGQFISLLKDGSYSDKAGNQLPDFSMNDIGELMKHLGDTTQLKAFPVNPISSKITNPKILNECIMWTIEGIRIEKKYPSLEPCVVDTDINHRSRLTNKQLLALSQKYIDWYNEYKLNPSAVLRKKDLLENTTYKWD